MKLLKGNESDNKILRSYFNEIASSYSTKTETIS